jgi:hypothetical protein
MFRTSFIAIHLLIGAYLVLFYFFLNLNLTLNLFRRWVLILQRNGRALIAV